MPEFVGLKRSNFGQKKDQRQVEPNEGKDLTTDMILRGLNHTKPMFSGEYIKAMKQSSFYVSEIEPKLKRKR